MQISDFRDRPLLLIDLEMTGLNPTIHEITEVGALVVNGKTLEIIKEYEVKVKPEHIETANPESLRINGYDPAQWDSAIPLSQMLTQLNTLAPGGMIAGWNITYDWMFLEMAYRKYSIQPSFDYHKIDVLGMAWMKLQSGAEPKILKLSEVCKYLGINRVDQHRALADIKATYEVFRKLIA